MNMFDNYNRGPQADDTVSPQQTKPREIQGVCNGVVAYKAPTEPNLLDIEVGRQRADKLAQELGVAATDALAKALFNFALHDVSVGYTMGRKSAQRIINTALQQLAHDTATAHARARKQLKVEE
jgi:hypothetical protein